jgi:hypothetical protein
MVNTRARRRVARFAAVAVLAAVAVGGVAMAAWRLGPTVWTLTAPADRLGTLIADAEREPTRGTTTPGAGVIAPPALADSSRTARATTSRVAAVGEGARGPLRLGARVTVPDSTSAPAPAETAESGELGEPAFTMEVERGRTIYRMNGDLIVDPEHQREGPVEAGFEYRFGKRGLEKFKLLEGRR